MEDFSNILANLLVTIVVVIAFLVLYQGIPRLGMRQLYAGFAIGVIFVLLGIFAAWAIGHSIYKALSLNGSLVLGQQLIPIGYGIIIVSVLATIRYRHMPSAADVESELNILPNSKYPRVSLAFVILLALISITLFIVSFYSE